MFVEYPLALFIEGRASADFRRLNSNVSRVSDLGMYNPTQRHLVWVPLKMQKRAEEARMTLLLSPYAMQV